MNNKYFKIRVLNSELGDKLKLVIENYEWFPKTNIHWNIYYES